MQRTPLEQLGDVAGKTASAMAAFSNAGKLAREAIEEVYALVNRCERLGVPMPELVEAAGILTKLADVANPTSAAAERLFAFANDLHKSK